MIQDLHTVTFLDLDFLCLAGGISETSPRAKLQTWQERFCRQSAPRESSGRTDYTNLRHFSARVFLVRGHGREVPRMRNLSFDCLPQMTNHDFDIIIFGRRHV